VVKAQIHAGGRGKGRFKESRRARRRRAHRALDGRRRDDGSGQQMLGKTLVTEQTGPAGKQVNRIYIEDGSEIAQGILPLDAGRPPFEPVSDHLSRPRAA
jgi:succinyl-CoA synthetase beta subunit